MKVKSIEHSFLSSWRTTKAVHVGLWILLVMDISRVMQHFPALSAIRPALLVFMICCGLVFLRPKDVNWYNLMRDGYGKGILAIVLFALISVPFGISLGASAVFFLEGYSKVLVCYAMVVASIRRLEHVVWYAWAYVVSCWIWAIMIMVVFDLQPAGDMMRLGNLYSLDPNDVGLVLVIGVHLSLWLFSISSRVERRMIGLGLLGIMAAIARTGSRGAMLGLAVSGLYVLFTLKGISFSKRIGIPFAMVLGLALAAPPGYWQQMKTIIEPEDDYNLTSETGRKAIALRGLTYMQQYPLFGVGMGNFPRAEGTIGRREEALRGVGVTWTSSHNTYIEVGSEIGPGALLVWISLLIGSVMGLRNLRRKLEPMKNRKDTEYRILFMGSEYMPGAIIGFAICSIFLAFAYLIYFYLLIGMSAAIVWYGKSYVKNARGVRRAPTVLYTGSPVGVRF